MITIVNLCSLKSETPAKSGLFSNAIYICHIGTLKGSFKLYTGTAPFIETLQYSIINVFHDLGENTMHIFLNRQWLIEKLFSTDFESVALAFLHKVNILNNKFLHVSIHHSKCKAKGTAFSREAISSMLKKGLVEKVERHWGNSYSKGRWRL